MSCSTEALCLRFFIYDSSISSLMEKPSIIWYVSTIPAGIFGTLFEFSVENQVRNNYGLIAAILIAVGLFSFYQRKRKSIFRRNELEFSSLIGLFQALALIPEFLAGNYFNYPLLLGFRREDAVFFFSSSITTIEELLSKD